MSLANGLQLTAYGNGSYAKITGKSSMNPLWIQIYRMGGFAGQYLRTFFKLVETFNLIVMTPGDSEPLFRLFGMLR
jgi:hypothetical protein